MACSRKISRAFAVATRDPGGYGGWIQNRTSVVVCFQFGSLYDPRINHHFILHTDDRISSFYARKNNIMGRLQYLTNITQPYRAASAYIIALIIYIYIYIYQTRIKINSWALFTIILATSSFRHHSILPCQSHLTCQIYEKRSNRKPLRYFHQHTLESLSEICKSVTIMVNGGNTEGISDVTSRILAEWFQESLNETIWT